MGRKAQPDARVQVTGRVSPMIKTVIDDLAKQEDRTASWALEVLLKETPRVKAKIRENGKRSAK
jgi:hypothetical protein